MSKGIPAYFRHGKYNIKSDDVCRLALGCNPQDVHGEVIVTPDWSADFLAEVADKVSSVFEDKVYDIHYRDKVFTLVRTCIGAPWTGDAILALSCTPCRRIIFTGSFGSLSYKLKIGDLLVETEAVSGDGFSSYLPDGELSLREFLKPVKPHAGLNALLNEHAGKATVTKNITLHQGRIFSTDTIIAQFQHLDMITGKLACTGIEMETAAVFNAAALTGMAAAALLIVSDVIPIKKSLFSGRTDKERERYREIKSSVLSKIIMETLFDERLSNI
jgi:purine-nucleoside phosphorylase